MNRLLSPLPEVQSRTEVVAKVVREAILSQQMRPGDTLVERRIAEDLGVSKTPVREALITLQQSGLVTVGSNRRLAVASLTLDDVVFIYEKRVLLEAWALRQAELDEATVKQARQALDDAREARQEGRQTEEILANRRFHRTLYATCGNPYIIRSLDELQDLTALAVATVLWEQSSGGPKVEHEQHGEILDAAAAGDLEQAATLLTDHIRLSVVGKVDSEVRL